MIVWDRVLTLLILVTIPIDLLGERTELGGYLHRCLVKAHPVNTSVCRDTAPSLDLSEGGSNTPATGRE